MTTQIDFSDPLVLGAIAAAVLAALLLLILHAASKAARAVQPLQWQMAQLGTRVQSLGDGQQHLAGGLHHVSEAQAKAQAHMMQMMEARLAQVTEAMGESLQGNAVRTARSLGDLHARLEAIDKAQSNIEKLSGNVLSLQDILSNKQARGAFGEIQLHEIVTRALPPDAYTMQATLSNGKRVDCLVHLPKPPGAIAIDAKFPLEAYEALRNATTDAEKLDARRQMRAALRHHIRAIAEKYILDGETADGALMFLPSEAVYAELHANFPDLVREGFDARVWVVSPTTCMATLNTMRAVLKDARMREQAGAIRRELGALYRDIERLGDRVESLDRHFGQASRDISEIKVSADKAGRRAKRLDHFDFEELAPDAAPLVAAPKAAE